MSKKLLLILIAGLVSLGLAAGLRAQETDFGAFEGGVNGGTPAAEYDPAESAEYYENFGDQNAGDAANNAPSRLVPCDGLDCDWNDLFKLGSNLLQFFIYISAFVAGVAFAVAGVMFLLYSTNPSKREEAKKLLWRILIGFVAVLAAALIVKTIINSLVKPESGLQVHASQRLI